VWNRSSCAVDQVDEKLVGLGFLNDAVNRNVGHVIFLRVTRSKSGSISEEQCETHMNANMPDSGSLKSARVWLLRGIGGQWQPIDTDRPDMVVSIGSLYSMLWATLVVPAGRDVLERDKERTDRGKYWMSIHATES